MSNMTTRSKTKQLEINKELNNYCKNEMNLSIEKLKYFIDEGANFCNIISGEQRTPLGFLCINSNKSNLSYDMTKLLIENEVHYNNIEPPYDFMSTIEYNSFMSIIEYHKNLTLDIVLLILKNKEDKLSMNENIRSILEQKFDHNDQIKIAEYNDSFKYHLEKKQSIINYVNDKYEHLLDEEKQNENYIIKLKEQIIKNDERHSNELDNLEHQLIKNRKELIYIKNKVVNNEKELVNLKDIFYERFTDQLDNVEEKVIDHENKLYIMRSKLTEYKNELNNLKETNDDKLNRIMFSFNSRLRELENVNKKAVESKRQNIFLIILIMIILVVFLKFNLNNIINEEFIIDN